VIHLNSTSTTSTTSDSGSAADGGSLLVPMVLQNKYDIYHRGRQLDTIGDDVLKTCQELHIHMVGYSPFSSFPFAMLPLADPVVAHIADRQSSLLQSSTIVDGEEEVEEVGEEEANDNDDDNNDNVERGTDKEEEEVYQSESVDTARVILEWTIRQVLLLQLHLSVNITTAYISIHKHT
jgi:hypothetical protein